MRTARPSILLGALTLASCLDGAALDAELADSERPPREWPTVVVESGELVLDCAEPAASDVHVLFECDSVTIYACDELSDAVLEYENGKRQRFTRLRAQTATLAARGVHDGQRIVSVRVPDLADRHAVTAGERRFTAPADSCGPQLAALP
jgi:hypothetical protein